MASGMNRHPNLPMTGHYVFVCLCADLDITYGRDERQVILVTGMSSAPNAEYLLVFADVSSLEGSADPPVRGCWDAVSQPARQAGGAVGAGPVQATASSSMISAASSIAVGPAWFVTGSPFRVSRVEDTGRSPSPGNQQAISFVWCA